MEVSQMAIESSKSISCQFYFVSLNGSYQDLIPLSSFFINILSYLYVVISTASKVELAPQCTTRLRYLGIVVTVHHELNHYHYSMKPLPLWGFIVQWL